MSWSKARPKGASTAARGYGHRDHVLVRQRLITALRDGDPCAECRRLGKYHPMYRWQITTLKPTQKLHLSHNPQRTAYIGLSWARCNMSDGARRGRQRQQQKAIRYSNVW